ncbi:MAG TPA: hypothetical protein VKJ01_04515 [Candidatus Solibacter sp.]|nr:hypothetical protein [Candidatus Solibacter sp.]
MRAFVFGILLLLTEVGSTSLRAEDADHTLLSTAALAREIAALQGPKADMRTDAGFLQSRVAKMRRVVGAFIIRQVEAYQTISPEDLQRHLRSAFGGTLSGWISGPRVIAESAGPRTTHRTFVIAYGWYGFYGKGGSETILESFVWDQGRGAHLGAGLVPVAFSGFLTEQEAVCWFPDPSTYWVLVSGQVGGASGRVLRGAAAVFEISPEQVKTVWTAPPGIGNVSAYVPLSGVPRWEIEYVDAKKFYSDLPNSRLLDVFQVDYAKRTFRRLIHQPLD